MPDDGARVLVVDDETAIRRFLRTALAANGYTVFEAATGEEGVAGVTAHRPDLVILDLGLPDVDGIEVTRILREWSRVPIIILSVREREGDKVAALDAGADDYVTKPFGTGELLARMRVALRRAAPALDAPVFESGDLSIDLARRLVRVADREVQLTPTEYDLLRALVTNADRVLTHRHLLRAVWGAGYDQDAHLLHVNMSNLRRKLEPDPARPRFIVTEPGVGYRLRATVER
jgi:two-component system, OmpR family, KDP operon response regulator KdpE